MQEREKALEERERESVREIKEKGHSLYLIISSLGKVQLK